ncbi:acetate--CoA ligase family protein [Specibacter sp. RAF43]|uniref:acetate--CoA ligase family protein n=1 Tax=Specibacter sp. RAF43 TaxID=3233057 RepID=UPI003F9CB173
MFTDLLPLLRPTSVAVVGATDRLGAAGQIVMSNLATAGYAGTVAPVNPGRETVGGLPAYPTVSSIGHEIDCVVIATPRDSVLQAVRDAGEAGARGCIVYTSGFGESDAKQGSRDEAELRRLATSYGMALLGPNCVGLINFVDRIPLTFSGSGGDLVRHNQAAASGLAVVAQSGALGQYVLHAQARGVAFSHFVSTGNSVVLDVGDIVYAMADDPRVSAICLTYEGLRESSRILDALDHAKDRSVPVVVVKAGMSSAGATAVSSHTGAAVGDARATLAALEARSAIIAHDLSTMVETAQFLGKNRDRRPNGEGTVIVSGSGGAGVLACDAAERHGVTLATLRAETVDAVGTAIPSYGAGGNPIDVTATDTTGTAIGTCVSIVGDAKETSSVLLPLGVALHTSDIEKRLSRVIEASENLAVPLAVTWMSEWRDPQVLAVLERHRSISLFSDLDRACHAIRAWHRINTREAWPTAAAGPVASPLQPTGGLVNEVRSAEVLRDRGVVFAPMIRLDPDGSHPDLQTWSYYPAVVKVVSDDIAHKAAVGGIVLGATSTPDIAQAVRNIRDNVTRNAPDAAIDGFVVQQIITGSTEVLVGAVRDHQYGPVLAIGPGGGGAGAGQEIGVVAAPATRHRIVELIRRTPGIAHLSSAAQEHLAGILLGVSDLMMEQPDVSEVEMNPLIVRASEPWVVAVDALIRTTTQTSEVTA